MSNSSSIDKLQQPFFNELNAVFRYSANSKYLKSLGLYKISEKLDANALDEMKHVDVLMDRIISLGGNVITIPKIVINRISQPEDVQKMFVEDLEIETNVTKVLVVAITELEKEGDFCSAIILRDILNSESHHSDWISQQLSLIDLIGISGYLNKNG